MTVLSKRAKWSALARIIVVFALLVAACGDDASSVEADTRGTGARPSSTASDSTEAPGTSTTTRAPGAESEGPPVSSESGVSTATVTIGDDTWQFDSESGPTAACNTDFYGGVRVTLSAPGLAGSFVMMLPGDEWPELGIDDPANAVVTITEDDQEWYADPRQNDRFDDLAEGSSVISSWAIDGNTISGEGTFLDRNSYFGALGDLSQVDIRDGTFVVRCEG